MKSNICLLLAILFSTLFFPACKSWNRTQKGAAIGTATGGAAGAIIGRASGNTALGAVIGAAVGGAAGAVIGNQMDKQAEEIKRNVPGASVHRVGEGIVIEFADDVLFGFDRQDLSANAKSSLNQLTTILQKYPDTDIEIHGHTDSQGPAKYNQGLSERRADAVADYLRGRNIASSRLKTIGYGEKKPKFENSTAEGRSKNRRVEFAITANEKMQREAANQAGK